jgi:putative hemolysin
MIVVEILVIISLIFLNGYFALSEIALLNVKKSRLRYLSSQGNKKAQKALFLVRRSAEMLSTIQIAITTIGIFAGAFGGATIARHLEGFLFKYQFLAAYSEMISVAVVVIIITYFSLVIGELVPKQIALYNPEKLSLKTAGVIIVLMKIFAPFVKILSFSTKNLMKIIFIKPFSEQIVTKEEIKFLISEGVKMGSFEKTELKIVENIFYLGNRPIKDFMTLNKDILCLNVSDSIQEIKNKIEGSDNTVFPVYKGDKNNFIGAIEINDILYYLLAHGSKKVDLINLVQPVTKITAETPSFVAIERLKKSDIRIAIISDTENKTLGVISFHDILEAIVGEFQIKDQ